MPLSAIGTRAPGRRCRSPTPPPPPRTQTPPRPPPRRRRRRRQTPPTPPPMPPPDPPAHIRPQTPAPTGTAAPPRTHPRTPALNPSVGPTAQPMPPIAPISYPTPVRTRSRAPPPRILAPHQTREGAWNRSLDRPQTQGRRLTPNPSPAAKQTSTPPRTIAPTWSPALTVPSLLPLHPFPDPVCSLTPSPQRPLPARTRIRTP